MARLIKHPLLWAVVGSVLLAIWQLPADPPPRPTPRITAWTQQLTAMDEARGAAWQRMAQLNEELILIRVADSLRVVMQNSGPLVIDLEPKRTPTSLEAEVMVEKIRAGIRTSVEQEISGFPYGQKMKIGVFALPVSQWGHPGVGQTRNPGSGDLFLFQGDEPACVLSRDTDGYARASDAALQLSYRGGPWYHAEEPETANVLGPCRYYAAYGLPGANISEWMKSGGAALAMKGAHTKEQQLFDRSGSRMFGLRSPNTSLLPAAEGCLVGRMEDCVAAATSPRSIAPISAGFYPPSASTGTKHPDVVHSWIRYRGGYGLAGVSDEDGRLVADIESAFGPERFQQFWSSDQPVEVAFAAAFNLPLGEWVHGWLKAQVTPNKLGPGLSWMTLLYSLALISFCVSIVFVASRRREVG